MADPMIYRWNNFGLGIHPNDVELYSNSIREHIGHYNRDAHAHQLQRATFDWKQLNISKDGFQAFIDVHQFAPNEITVRTVDDVNSIVVEAKHDAREDEHGFIAREFIRRFKLPPDYHIEAVVARLSCDGILIIKAPPPAKGEGKTRFIKIDYDGPAHLSVGNEDIKADIKSDKVE